MKNEKSNGLLKGCYGWFIIAGICIATGVIFSRNSNRKEKERDAELNYKREIKNKVSERFDEKSCAPYLDYQVLNKILNGEERYMGDVCDIFPEGQFYLIDKPSFWFDYDANNKTYTSKRHNNKITIDCSLADITENDNIFLLVYSKGCEFVNYKRISKIDLQVQLIIDYKEADYMSRLSVRVFLFVNRFLKQKSE